jgi:hypothetical protein
MKVLQMIHPTMRKIDLIKQKDTWRRIAVAKYDTSGIDSFRRSGTNHDDTGVTYRTGSTLSAAEKAAVLRALHEEIQ